MGAASTRPGGWRSLAICRIPPRRSGDRSVWRWPASLTALILGIVCTDYFLIPPRGEFWLKSRDGVLELALYSSVGLGFVLIGGLVRVSTLGTSRKLRVREALRGKRGTHTPHAAFLRDRRLESGDRAEYHRGGRELLGPLRRSGREVPANGRGFRALVGLGRPPAHPTRDSRFGRTRRGIQHGIPRRVARRRRPVSGCPRKSLLRRNGKRRRLTGVFWDVTERRQAEEEPARYQYETRGGGEVPRATGSSARCRGGRESRGEDRPGQYAGGEAVWIRARRAAGADH